MELVQQSTKARQAGDEGEAQTLLAEARKMDPTNPMVLEHIEPLIPFSALALQAAAGKPAPESQINSLVDRTSMLAGETPGSLRIGAPVLASAIHVAPAGGVKDFNLRGESSDVLRQVASAYGIRAIIDDSVEHKNLRFDLENVTYDQAMAVLMSMAHVFAVPVDETSVLVAKDDASDRQRLERQLEETIDVPGSTNEQLNELAQVVRNVFDVKQATVQTGAGTILVRAPEAVLGPLNKTIEGLIESPGEVLLEVKMVEVNKTRTTDIGTTLPTQFTIFNVDAAATSIVNSNQALGATRNRTRPDSEHRQQPGRCLETDRGRPGPKQSGDEPDWSLRRRPPPDRHLCFDQPDAEPELEFQRQPGARRCADAHRGPPGGDLPRRDPLPHHHLDVHHRPVDPRIGAEQRHHQRRQRSHDCTSGSSSVVECFLAKEDVAGSTPVSRLGCFPPAIHSSSFQSGVRWSMRRPSRGAVPKW